MEKLHGTSKCILGGAINGKLTEVRLKAKKLNTNENAADAVTEQPSFHFCLFS